MCYKSVKHTLKKGLNYEAKQDPSLLSESSYCADERTDFAEG